MPEYKNIHVKFLSEAKSSQDREKIALKLKKTPGEINSLTAFHDFMRLESVNKYLAKIFIVAGIRGVSHLAKLSVSQVQKKINNSRIGKSVNVHPALIQESINQAKKTEVLVAGLESEKYFLQRKGYILSKSDTNSYSQTVGSRNYNDIVLCIITILLLGIFSYISLYFLALIPVLLALHILLESKIGTGIFTKSSLNISSGKTKLISAGFVSIFSCIFAIGFFSGNIHSNIQNSLQHIIGNTNLKSQSYFPKEIHDHYTVNDMSREELIKILTTARKIDIEGFDEIECFKDSFQSKYPKEICYAKDQGYIQGDSLGNFYPNRPISHAAGLKFILNFYGYNVPRRSLYLSYEDLQKNQWYTTYAEFAKRIGLIDDSVTRFYPDEVISIEQVDRYISVLSTKKK